MGRRVNEIIGKGNVDYISENGGLGNIEQNIECITQGGQIRVVRFLVVGSKFEMPDAVALTLS